MQPTYVSGICDRVQPFENRPRAAKVLKTDSAHVVAFAFGAGQLLKEHAAHHPVVITAVTGWLRFQHPGGTVDLRPGDLIHLPPMVRHSVEAVEDSILTVTMLVTAPGGEPE